MPFQRMPNAVPADAECRSSGCRMPFQRMPNAVAKPEKSITNQQLSAGRGFP